MDKCPNCGSDKMCWQNDFSFEDFGYEGDGIVSIWSCLDCETEVYIAVPIKESDAKETSERKLTDET